LKELDVSYPEELELGVQDCMQLSRFNVDAPNMTKLGLSKLDSMDLLDVVVS